MENELERAKEINKKVQAFIWENKDMILKGKKTYEGAHELWGTCYPAAWFLHEVLLQEGIITTVARKRFNEHGNHTYLMLMERKSYLRTDDMEIVFYSQWHPLDPTADQIPEGWDYSGWVKSSQMIAETKMPHKMTRKLLELWKESEL